MFLKDDAIPVINPVRRVAQSLKERLKNKLDEMVEDKVIGKVDESNEWVSNIVIAEKPNKNLVSVWILKS